MPDAAPVTKGCPSGKILHVRVSVLLQWPWLSVRSRRRSAAYQSWRPVFSIAITIHIDAFFDTLNLRRYIRAVQEPEPNVGRYHVSQLRLRALQFVAHIPISSPPSRRAIARLRRSRLVTSRIEPKARTHSPPWRGFFCRTSCRFEFRIRFMSLYCEERLRKPIRKGSRLRFYSGVPSRRIAR